MAARKVVCLAFGFLLWFTGIAVRGQDNGEALALQKKLAETYKLTTVSADRSSVVTAGAAVVLKAPGLLMYATSDALAPSNTYKNGKIGQGMAGFGKDLLTTTMMAGQGSTDDIPKHNAAVGEKFWVVRINARKGQVAMFVLSDPDDSGLRYWAELKFPFDKKSVPTPEVALSEISQALAVDNSSAEQAQDTGGQPSPDQGAPQNQLAGHYFLKETGAHLILGGASMSFILVTPDGRNSVGTYTVAGDTLTLTYKATGRSSSFKIQGDTLVADSGLAWVRIGGGAAPAPEVAVAPPPPPPASYQDVPPPPPPPAPAPTVSNGMTPAQVTDAFGEPQRKAAIGAKTIFFYTDLKMKVTFTNGKVTNVD